MLTIIHGDDISASRNKLIEEKEKEQNVEIIHFDGSKITIADFSLSLDSVSLFKTKRLIIIENLLAGHFSKEKEEIFIYLDKLKISDRIIIWEGQEINSSILRKYFPRAKIILCKLPTLIFKFLDSLGRESSANLLLSFHQILKKQEAEFIFVMMLRQFRYLLVAKDLGPVGMTFLSPWQSQKFAKQAAFFTMEEIVSAYRNLLALEYKVKSGTTPLSLAQLIDIFLVSL